MSAQPEWVELRVPCDRATLSPLQKLLGKLETDVPPEMAEANSYAFSEMFSNAIEHGCNLDPEKHVAVSILRLKRSVICRIKDPGEGFDPHKEEIASRAKRYGVSRVPAIVIDGKLAECCAGRISSTSTSHDGQAMLRTSLIDSWHAGQPALKISILRLAAIMLVTARDLDFPQSETIA